MKVNHPVIGATSYSPIATVKNPPTMVGRIVRNRIPDNTMNPLTLPREPNNAGCEKIIIPPVFAESTKPCPVNDMMIIA